MILFKNNNSHKPYSKIREYYAKAINVGEKFPERINVSSYNIYRNEVSSRYVNLKVIDNDVFIFFTNYTSPKAKDFHYHEQIAATIYWESINIQIRFKAHIKKNGSDANNQYFTSRSKEKNALAISSNQSKTINSYDEVVEKYHTALKNKDLSKCPNYWGGFSFTPYEIEFWEGNEFRLNKRNLYTKDNTSWNHFILEP